MHIPIKTYLESVPGFFGIRLEEEPEFEILFSTDEGLEVRRYVSTVQAQTLVEGDRDHAVDEGFRRLAKYIFGENSGEKEMSMTTPVLQGRKDGLEMSMTTPVLQEQKDGAWLISFILPSDISVAEAPQPNDERVKIMAVEPKTVAVLQYSGNQTEERMREKAKELLQLISENGFTTTSEVTWAQYDQPLAIPFLKRNEVQVEVSPRMN